MLLTNAIQCCVATKTGDYSGDLSQFYDDLRQDQANAVLKSLSMKIAAMASAG